MNCPYSKVELQELIINNINCATEHLKMAKTAYDNDDKSETVEHSMAVLSNLRSIDVYSSFMLNGDSDEYKMVRGHILDMIVMSAHKPIVAPMVV